jgi:hypothetical protein
MAEETIERGVISHVNRTHYESVAGLTDVQRRNLDLEEAMMGLRDALIQPEYVGDSETALVHYLGRSAFDDIYSEGLIRFSRFFGQELDKQATGDPIPVLVAYDAAPYSEPTRREQTALVIVDMGKDSFRSFVEHERDVVKPGFADEVAVTTRTLTLLGDTVTIDADLIGWGTGATPVDPTVRIVAGRDGVILDKRVVIDGENGSKPATNDPRRSIHERSVSLHDDNYDLGWMNIGDRIARGIRHVANHRNTAPSTLGHVSRLIKFFESGSLGTTEGLFEVNPELKDVFDSFAGVQDALKAVGARTL